jgi:hypothetical protein
MAMERAGAALTRASLMAQLTNGSFDLGGFPLAFAPNNNQGSSSVFLTVINREGRFEAVERLTA